MDEREIEQAMLEEMEDLNEEKSLETSEDQFLNQQMMQEAYGAPEPEEKRGSAEFLHKAAFETDDTVKTTFLEEQELGRPLFSVRFLLDLHDISKYYLDPLIKEMGLNPEEQNRIANYFWEKIQNITGSGMSNKGFAMQLNVTRKVDTTKKKLKDIPELPTKRR